MDEPTKEALEFLKEALAYAYKMGLHEIGYDPIKQIEAALAARMETPK